MLDHAALEKFVQAGLLAGARAVGKGGGWEVVVKYGSVEQTLAVQRSGKVRVFRRLETLAAYLKGLGIAQFEVDASGFGSRASEVNPRADLAPTLKGAHNAAAYDAWFRAQIQASLDDPSPAIADADARARFSSLKAALRKR